MVREVLIRLVLLLAVAASLYVAPAWLCFVGWYGVLVVWGTSLFLKRARELSLSDGASQYSADG